MGRVLQGELGLACGPQVSEGQKMERGRWVRVQKRGERTKIAEGAEYCLGTGLGQTSALSPNSSMGKLFHFLMMGIFLFWVLIKYLRL